MDSQGEEPRVWVNDGAPPGGQGGHHGPGPGRRWTRWVGLAIGFAVLVAVIVVQHYLAGGPQTSPTPSTSPIPLPSSSTGDSAPASSQSTTTQPSDSGTASKAVIHTGSEPYTTTLAGSQPVPLPDSSGWELVGYQRAPGNVIRYDPSTGTLVRDGYLVGEKYPTWTVRGGEVTSASGAPRVTVERVDGPGHGQGSVGGFATASQGGGAVAHWWPTVVDFSDHGCWQVTATAADESITYIVKI